jgi:hypothetical protein
LHPCIFFIFSSTKAYKPLHFTLHIGGHAPLHISFYNSLKPLALHTLQTGGQHHFRLLSGHENGQLLLWHPDGSRLAPLISIGEPGAAVRARACVPPSCHLPATFLPPSCRLPATFLPPSCHLPA